MNIKQQDIGLLGVAGAQCFFNGSVRTNTGKVRLIGGRIVNAHQTAETHGRPKAARMIEIFIAPPLSVPIQRLPSPSSANAVTALSLKPFAGVKVCMFCAVGDSAGLKPVSPKKAMPVQIVPSRDWNN